MQVLQAHTQQAWKHAHRTLPLHRCGAQSTRPVTQGFVRGHSCRKQQRGISRTHVIVPKAGLFGFGGKSETALTADDPDQVALRETAVSQRNMSWLAFWAQLALSLVSSGVLVFSLAFTARAPGPAEWSKYCTLAGIACAWISTFFAHGFLRLSRQLADGGVVSREWLQASLLRNSTLSLAGIALTVVGLQASVGTLVAKTLVTAVQGAPYMVQGNPNMLVSLDVFSLQAATNTLLSHVVALMYVNGMLGQVNKPPPREQAVIAEGVPQAHPQGLMAWHKAD